MGSPSQNVHFIANHGIWKDDVLVGFEEPVIHSLNKCHAPLAQYLPPAPPGGWDVLLAGDVVGDAAMADALPTRNVVRVCFFGVDPTTSAAQELAQYGSLFDAVVTGDGPMHVLSHISAHALGQRDGLIADHIVVGFDCPLAAAAAAAVVVKQQQQISHV
eukprot:TRINITY_DN768_c0_g1_i1.p3 TRINITY_DN768_c0_g1~~TRINITY_DN768_c0_g1_i1.p3  ORF type:complete len:160 (-),score=55.63 TRINITY_DN768_c0_g1_i1:10-489(-)